MQMPMPATPPRQPQARGKIVDQAPGLNGSKLATSIMNGVPDTQPVVFTRLPTHTMISEFYYHRVKGELKIHLWVTPIADANVARRIVWEALTEALGSRSLKWTDEVELPYPGAAYRSEAHPMGAIRGSIYVGLRVPTTTSFRELPQQVRNVIALIMDIDKKSITRRTI